MVSYIRTSRVSFNRGATVLLTKYSPHRGNIHKYVTSADMVGTCTHNARVHTHAHFVPYIIAGVSVDTLVQICAELDCLTQNVQFSIGTPTTTHPHIQH